MDILEYIKQMQEMYGDDVITTADKINRPEPKREVQEIELFNKFNRRNPKADGGQLVAPSVDGSRPGYAGKMKWTTKEVQEIYTEIMNQKECWLQTTGNMFHHHRYA